jgi:hypothetical protein
MLRNGLWILVAALYFVFAYAGNSTGRTGNKELYRAVASNGETILLETETEFPFNYVWWKPLGVFKISDKAPVTVANYTGKCFQKDNDTICEVYFPPPHVYLHAIARWEKDTWFIYVKSRYKQNDKLLLVFIKSEPLSGPLSILFGKHTTL